MTRPYVSRFTGPPDRGKVTMRHSALTAFYRDYFEWMSLVATDYRWCDGNAHWRLLLHRRARRRRARRRAR
mgnify:CR=1 FL=1